MTLHEKVGQLQQVAPSPVGGFEVTGEDPMEERIDRKRNYVGNYNENVLCYGITSGYIFPLLKKFYEAQITLWYLTGIIFEKYRILRPGVLP